MKPPAGCIQCSSIWVRPPGAVCQSPAIHAISESVWVVPPTGAWLCGAGTRANAKAPASARAAAIRRTCLDLISLPLGVLRVFVVSFFSGFAVGSLCPGEVSDPAGELRLRNRCDVLTHGCCRATQPGPSWSGKGVGTHVGLILHGFLQGDEAIPAFAQPRDAIPKRHGVQLVAVD